MPPACFRIAWEAIRPDHGSTSSPATQDERALVSAAPSPRVDPRPAISAERGEPAPARGVHAAEGDDGQRRASREPGEARQAERPGAGMAGGGEDRREEEQARAIALRLPDLREIVDRGAAQPLARTAAV